MGKRRDRIGVNATHARRDRFLCQRLVVGLGRLRHDVGNHTEQFVDLRLSNRFRAATGRVVFASTAATAQVTIRFDFAAFARSADRFGVAARAISSFLSTCSLRSHDRHRLNHYCSDQTKSDGGTS